MQDSQPSEVGALVDDRIVLPPPRQEFSSPDKKYVFAVTALDNWKTPKSEGEFFAVENKVRKSLWKRTMPMEYCPRFVVLNNQGDVLLLDEWNNVKSAYAVMLLTRDNKRAKQHSFDAIQAVLDVPVAEIVRMAEHGWWITEPPQLDKDGKTAKVKAAGKILAINMSDGKLSLAKE